MTEKLHHDEIQVGKKIGEGGYGDVYQGNWHGISVAIKILKTIQIPEEVEKVFNHETQIMQRLRHKNVVMLYCTTSINDRKCMVMGLCCINQVS